MKRSLLLLALAVLFGDLDLPRAEATIFRRRAFRPIGRQMPYRPPGWDWKRTYPWSPYNYGRNIYNPLVGYPYVVPYGYPGYQQGYVDSPSPPVVYRAGYEPSVSGPLSSPPPGTALIRLRVPDEWAKVLFDGEDTSNMGLRRTFVTPDLQPGKTYRYVMTVLWTRDGKPMREQRVVRVRAGQIVEIDLTKPAKS